MREFGAPISREQDQQLRDDLLGLFNLLPDARIIYGVDYAMDQPELPVIQEHSLKLEDGQRFRIAITTEAARPPFEWLIELSSEVGESDYFKHYLVRDNDTVLAQRKILTAVDEAELRIIQADLAYVRELLNQA